MNTIYKVIAKLIANRMSEVMSELLSPNQSAFTRGRLILNNIMLPEELLRGFEHKHTTRRACLVLDLSKAFDSV